MTEIRKQLRERLSPEECATEEWYYEVQKFHEEAAVGALIRCMVIAATNPQLPFWAVLELCHKSCEEKLQLEDLMRRPA
jgi:hypothetical protein